MWPVLLSSPPLIVSDGIMPSIAAKILGFVIIYCCALAICHVIADCKHRRIRQTTTHTIIKFNIIQLTLINIYFSKPKTHLSNPKNHRSNTKNQPLKSTSPPITPEWPSSPPIKTQKFNFVFLAISNNKLLKLEILPNLVRQLSRYP